MSNAAKTQSLSLPMLLALHALVTVTPAIAQSAQVLSIIQAPGPGVSVTINIQVNNPAPNPSINNIFTLNYVPGALTPGATPFSVQVTGVINGAFPFYSFNGSAPLPVGVAGHYVFSTATFFVNSTLVTAPVATNVSVPSLLIPGPAPFVSSVTSYTQGSFTAGAAPISVGVRTPVLIPQCSANFQTPSGGTVTVNLAYVPGPPGVNATLTGALAVDASTQPSGNYQVLGVVCVDPSLLYGPLLAAPAATFPGGTPPPIVVPPVVPFTLLSYGAPQTSFPTATAAQVTFHLRLQSADSIGSCTLGIRRPNSTTDSVPLTQVATGPGNTVDVRGFLNINNDSFPNGDYEVTGLNCSNTAGRTLVLAASSFPDGSPAPVQIRRCPIFTPPPGGGGPVDLATPAIVCLAVNQTRFDVSANDQRLEIQTSLSDNLSGVSEDLRGVVWRLTGPGGSRDVFPQGPPSNGTVNFVLPRYSPAGTYLLGVEVNDRAGNKLLLDSTGLAARGFTSAIQVVSSPSDTQGPVLGGISFLPPSVNASSGEVSPQVSVTATDGLSGFTSACLTLENPSVSLRYRQIECVSANAPPSAGSRTISGTFRLFRNSTAGNLVVSSISLRDAAGNQTIINQPTAPSLVVVSSPSDEQRPKLTSFDFSPKRIDTSNGPAVFTANLSLRDDVAGFGSAVGIRFGATSSSGRTVSLGVSCNLASSSNVLVTFPRNATYRCSIAMPAYAEQGYWNISSVNFGDERPFGPGDFGEPLNQVDLAQAGFPTLFYNGPAIPGTPDGFLGPTGGTVSSQATAGLSLFIGSGLLNGNLGVSLGVTPPPPNLPVPQGFSSAGMPVVAVGFTPTLRPDLASPGASLTVPLAVGLTSGATLGLFRLDPISNALTPALTPSGAPITSTVGTGPITFAGLRNAGSYVAYRRNPAELAGDINNDGSVNCADHALLRGALGRRVGQPGYLAKADLNSDGVIDIRDLTLFLRLLPPGTAC